MISETVVELSRWQFAVTAQFHLLCMPLASGLAVLLALMESAYVASGKVAYKNACLFWGRIFAVVFVLGLMSRLGLILQFGMNGSYFSHYVGDIFALPLAIETLSAVFISMVLFGPYFFGWERYGKQRHLFFIWLICAAVSIEMLGAAIMAGWMQNPLGAEFNYQSMRMELNDIRQFWANPAAFAKALHTFAAGYALTAATVLAVSAWLLLRHPQDELARLSYKMAAGLGLAATMALCLGDATPNQANPAQVRKLAVLEGRDSAALVPEIESSIRNGIKAYSLLQELRDERRDTELLAEFGRLKSDLSYALLLQRLSDHITDADDKMISAAAKSSLPAHPMLLAGIYRLMVACGVINLLLFVLASWGGFAKQAQPVWLLKLGIYLLPLPWLACIGGWYVAEAGIQPWSVAEILPAFLSVSSLSVKEIVLSLIVQIILYAGLLLAGVFSFRQSIQSHFAIQSQRVGL